MYIIAVDPGREKCGIAVMQNDGNIFYQQVIATADLAETVRACYEKYEPDCLVIGDGTTSKTAQATIKKAVAKLKLCVVDEYRTTDAAKLRYWQENPPKGWRKILPVTMQVPPVPVDDYVAVILAERYLSRENEQ